MGGIYIPDMEMPKGPGKTITIYPNGMVRVWVNNKGCVELLEQRAVPVPEHGRLGDLDLLTKVLKAKAKNPLNQETAPYSWAFACECLADAVGDMPTIIPGR